MNNGNIKVDHPAKKSDLKGIGFPEESPDNLGSKDCWDALASSVYSLRQSLIDNDDYGTNTGFQKTLESMNKPIEDSKERTREVFQSMMESIY